MATLRGWYLDTLIQDAILVVSELVTNAIRHGTACTEGNADDARVELSWWCQPSRLICTVTDGSVKPPVLEPADPDTESGRGLQVVHALTVAWGWTALSTHGKAVWAAFQLPGTRRYADRDVLWHPASCRPKRPLEPSLPCGPANQYDAFVSESNAVESGRKFDPTTPNVARVYDYMLGGKDNLAADRQLAEQLLAEFPVAAWIARQNRAFVGRAVRFCAEEGVDQFLDVGSGLPTMDNVHEVARRVIPDAAVVYVDNDRVALTHANALLATSPGVSAIWGDVRDPGKILANAEARGLIDLSRPVVVLLTAILHFISDEEDPAGIVATFRDAMCPGSYLVLSHATHDVQPEESARARDMYRDRGASSRLVTRSRTDIAAFFAGFELADPGLVCTSQWRPQEPLRNIEPVDLIAGVGRKP